MALITLLDLDLAFGQQPLLQRAAFSLEAGERVGLIGRNGSGKSSLLNILAGRQQPDDGQRVVRDGLRIAHVAQEPAFDPEARVPLRIDELSALLTTEDLIGWNVATDIDKEEPADVATAWLAIRDPQAAIEILSEAHGASEDNVGSCELMSRTCTDMVLRNIPGTNQGTGQPTLVMVDGHRSIAFCRSRKGTEVVAIVGQAMILLVGGRMVLDGTLTIGELTAFQQAVVDPARDLAGLLRIGTAAVSHSPATMTSIGKSMARAMAAAARAFDTLCAPTRRRRTLARSPPTTRSKATPSMPRSAT